MTNTVNFLKQQIIKDPPRSQRECCRLGVRHAIASLGPVADADIPAAALGIARGLFGGAFLLASEDQQKTWVSMCEDEYRASVGVQS